MSSKTLIVRFPAAVCILLILFVGQGLGQETKLTWFGHAAFSLTTPRGKVLLIDPWLTNPANPDGPKAVASLQKVEFAAELKLRKVAFREMKPGQTLTFQGSRAK